MGINFFFFANYGVFTFFITGKLLPQLSYRMCVSAHSQLNATEQGFVYVLLSHFDTPIGEITLYRFLWTMAAEALYICTYVYRPPEPDVVGLKVAAYARAVEEYCTAVTDSVGNQGDEEAVSGSHYDSDSVYAKREAAIKARLTSMAIVANAQMTPRKKGYYRVDPHLLAPAINLELLIASSVAATCEEQLRRGSADLVRYLSGDSLVLMEQIISRLEGGATEEVEDLTIGKGGDDNPFRVVLIRIHLKLAEAGL
mmetsp:Transcript_26296/g.63123  ORF Transcript_26296/g.63123 Transcript_26296/m.63123 type:complete len:255 (-) Transcript_26296:1327-2091(-)